MENVYETSPTNLPDNIVDFGKIQESQEFNWKDV